MSKTKAIGLLTVGDPFDQVPYTSQMLIVARGLVRLGYQVTYLAFKESKKEDSEKLAKEMGFQVLYLDCPNSILRLSKVNEIIMTEGLSVIITLLDHHKTIVDITNLLCHSIAWFPCHYKPLDRHTTGILSMFSEVVTLYPSAISIIKEALNMEVSCIPHVIYPFVASPTYSREGLRKKHDIPLDKLVVCMVGGNYDMNNRRSYDTSIAAFAKYHKQYPASFLYVQAFTSSQAAWCNDLDDIFQAYGLDPRVYRLNQTHLERNILDEIYSLSDIAFQGSKSEGFGLPNIEAQLAGLPVVSNSFGALADYCFNGLSVPPLQEHYDPLTHGVWSMPDQRGLAEALLKVSDNIDRYRCQSAEAIRVIGELMNEKIVLDQFKLLIGDPKSPSPSNYQPTYLCQILERLPHKPNHYRLYNVNTTSVSGEWTTLLPHLKSPYLVVVCGPSKLDPTFWEGLPKTLQIFIKVKYATLLIRSKFRDGSIYPMDNTHKLNPDKSCFILPQTVVRDMMKFNDNWNDCISWLKFYSRHVLTTELVNQVEL